MLTTDRKCPYCASTNVEDRGRVERDFPAGVLGEVAMRERGRAHVLVSHRFVCLDCRQRFEVVIDPG